ncbi:hypothetical protein HYU90_01190 [Candidatus Collierbacteria bacterium]|nr:hypothetical protein [Candidatus Collierbacteria bacterium]
MKTKLFFLAVLFILIFPTFSFFLGNKMFTFNDETQIANLHHYFKSIDLGQFPPRWATDMHFEYGSPFLSFNYQLPYYLGYLGHLAHLPNVVIFKLLLAFTVILGAVGMYAAGITITNSVFFSLFAAVLYSYTPYQSIDHFVRGSLGEVFALALFPWIFLSGYTLIKKPDTFKVIVLGIFLCFLFLSHQPAALVAIPFFTIIFLFSAICSKKISAILSLLMSLIAGLALSAYYWIPIIFEKKYIVTGGPFNYLDQFPFLKQLIYSAWTYQGANPFSSDTFSFQIGLVNLFILLFSFIFIFIKPGKKENQQNTWLFRLTLIMTMVAIFLMNIRSNFIWEKLSLLQAIQFPWRLLMFTTWFTPFLFLLLVPRLPTKITRPATLVLLIATIAINIGYFHPGLIVTRDDHYYNRIFLTREVLSPGETVSADYLNYAEDYAPLPINTVRPKALPISKLTSGSDSTKIEIVSQNPLVFKAKVENTVNETLTFHTFNYPGWKVVVDYYQTQIQPNDIGAITFSLPPGKHLVSILFTETTLRLFSNIISLSTLVITSLYLGYQLIRRRVTPTT